MENAYNFIKKHKILVIILSLILLLALIAGIPSLAKLKHRNSIYNVSSWDGTIASDYKSGNGNIDNPYIISNASEFAFFLENLKTEDYEDKYFELSNDIVINAGLFDYNETDNLKYTINDITYYVNNLNNEYYTDKEMKGTSIGKLNNISSISNFKGNLNGNSFSIFGLYISDLETEDLALFKTLEGTIEDLYVSNSVVFGNGNIAGLAVNAKNAVIKNVLYNGFVINNSESKKVVNELKPVSIISNVAETTTCLELSDLILTGTIKSVSLTGEWSGDSTKISSMKIITNGTENVIDLTKNSFTIDLGTNLLSDAYVVANSTDDGVSINFSNLKYTVQYYDNISSGFIANSINTSVTNSINKANVYGNYISSGFVGSVKETLQITNSYNRGNISSNYISSGLIGEIDNNENHTTINNSYNTGIISSQVLTSGIIGIAKNNTGLINLNNVINVSDNYAINTITNSTINIVDCYSLNGLTVYSGAVTTKFVQKTEADLYQKESLTKIGYSEFVSLEDIKTNVSNVWIYEDGLMPILYIDDLNNPVANININKLSWDNLSSELDIIEVSNNIIFSIEGVSTTNPVKEKYYFVSNSRTPLSKTDLDSYDKWLKYDDIVKIETSGYYVIYAKIIDNNGGVTYINTDIMMLNVSGFQAKITVGDNVWSEFKTKLSNLYVSEDITLSLYAHDDLITVTNIEYYISDKELTQENLEDIIEWQSYTSPITISEHGKYVVYAKITDIESKIRYINTDYILYDGYSEVLNIGTKNKQYGTNYITNDSSFKLTFEGDFELDFKKDYSHNFVSSILLPKGTKITFIDKNTNKIYGLQIISEDDLYGYNNSCEGKTNCSKYATYGFNLFNEIGTNNQSAYDESVNYEKTISNEKFVFTINFSETVLTNNYYDVSFHLAIMDDSNKKLYTTLNNSISNINIYSNINNSEINTSHKLISDYSNQTINYNSNSELGINFTNQISYPTLNNKVVIDTLYEKKKVGLMIGLYNENGEILSKTYLDNILFEVNEKEYFANSNGIIKINLGSAVDDSIKTLKIKTRENSSGLTNGSYYIKINEYLSNDGYYYDSLYTDEIVIPVVVEDQDEIIKNYNFDIEMSKESLMLNKNLDLYSVSFNILYSGELVNPNVKISLYEKKTLTAYNQEYNIIDLSEYVSDKLTEVAINKYSVNLENSLFTLNLVPNKFKNNGYKYVFELYDGSTKISEIQKYFIVK